MNELIMIWETIKMLSSLSPISRILLKAINPETYIKYCVYNLEEISNYDDNVVGRNYIKHINTCSNSSCDYYNRLTKRYETFNASVEGSSVIVFTTIGAMLATSIATLLIAPVLSVGVLLTRDVLKEKSLKKAIKEIEDELKLKWENEKK